MAPPPRMWGLGELSQWAWKYNIKNGHGKLKWYMEINGAWVNSKMAACLRKAEEMYNELYIQCKIRDFPYIWLEGFQWNARGCAHWRQHYSVCKKEICALMGWCFNRCFSCPPGAPCVVNRLGRLEMMQNDSSIVNLWSIIAGQVWFIHLLLFYYFINIV